MATQAQFLEAVRSAIERGWKVYPRSGGYGMNAPSCETEHPTPGYVLDANWYPSATYLDLRQLSFVYMNDRVSGVWTRECVPWVEAHDVKVSLAAAIDFLKSE